MTSMRTFQMLLAAFVVVIIASTTYAFAADNTGIPAMAGDSSNAISGYTVTNLAYSFNTADPTRLDAVSFTLNANARTVRIKLIAAGSTWYTCNPLSDNHWNCATVGATTVSIDQLEVFATSN